MHDNLKALGYAGAMLSIIAGLIAIAIGRQQGPVGGVIATGAVSLIVCLGSIALLVWLARRKDRAPDYLKQMFRQRYDCCGLGLALETDAVDGVGYFNVYFQNRFERPCQAKVMIKRAHGLALTENGRVCASALLSCPGGVFGVARVPFAVPAKLQGKKRRFELTAEVSYTSGQGRQLRFRKGKTVGKAGASGTVVILAALVGGIVGAATIAGRAARLKVHYPQGVGDQLPGDVTIDTEILWQPGDEETDLNLPFSESVETDDELKAAA
ncbi:MAG: hypothetical protein JSV91_06385 [Phycisphaerales bacterium]|nr:MAG: hypothetical protein JSV91_06385 [Phycisphaerales bacterium]